MLTKEQIKNLKPGDPVVISTTFICVDIDGDIRFKAPSLNGRRFVHFISPEYVSLPSDSQSSATAQLLRSGGGSTVNSQSKYDPTRMFRKGDIVRLKEWNGRCPALPHDWKFDNGLFKVHTDEKFNSSVEITRENSEAVYIAPICFIELITPVEELEPYYIKSETFDYEIRNANDDPDIGTSLAFHIMFQDSDESEILRVKSYYESYVYSREHAEADAEAECARLNAEWRKEQNND